MAHENEHSNSYWQGKVDSKLDELSEKIDLLTQEVTALKRQVGNGDTKFVTWAYLRDKLAIPVILAALTFVLFSVMPAIFVVVYLILGKV